MSELRRRPSSLAALMLAASLLSPSLAGAREGAPAWSPVLAGEPSDEPTSTPVPAPTQTPMPSATPTEIPPPLVAPPQRLRIARLAISAAVEYVGLAADGSMDVPRAWQNVAWYQLGVAPGAPGNAVMAGHLDSRSRPAVFANLRTLQPGDRLLVEDAAGQTRGFAVTEVASYLADEAPVSRVFGPADSANLTRHLRWCL